MDLLGAAGARPAGDRLVAARVRTCIADPYERADITSNTYYDWFISQPYLVFAAQVETAKFLATFKAFPPRRRAASFSIDQAVEKMKQNIGGN